MTVVSVREGRTVCLWCGGGGGAEVGEEELKDLISFDLIWFLYWEDDGFRPWPSLPTGPCYTNMHNSKNITLTLQIFHQKKDKKRKKIFFKKNRTTPPPPPPPPPPQNPTTTTERGVEVKLRGRCRVVHISVCMRCVTIHLYAVLFDFCIYSDNTTFIFSFVLLCVLIRYQSVMVA